MGRSEISMGMWVNEGTLAMSFVSYIVNVECMCDASYVAWKYRQYRRYHVISARKYKTLQNVNIPGARFSSSGTPLFYTFFCKICCYQNGYYFIGFCYLFNVNIKE